MPRKKKARRAGGGISYDKARGLYKATYKGKFIGRYETCEKAEEAIYEYKHMPEITPSTGTFKEVYDGWYNKHLKEETKRKKLSSKEVEESNTFKGHRAAYTNFGALHEKQFCLLKIKEVEAEITKKNQPTQRKMKVLMHFLLDYALREEIVDGAKYNELYAVKISSAVKSEKHYPFSQEEIDKLWAASEDDIYIQFILMCIYCGCRCGEMAKVKKIDVMLDKNCFWVQKGKTKSARRAVPIHKKTKKFFENWMNLNDSDYLITRYDGKNIRFSSDHNGFVETYWIPTLKSLGIYNYVRENGDKAVHYPHDVRTTFSTRWADQGLDQTLRKKIQGHSTGDVGIDVYTKPFIATLVKEINKLK